VIGTACSFKLQFSEFSEKNINYFRLKFDLGVTKISISSAELSKESGCLKFGNFESSVRSKSIPASVAQRSLSGLGPMHRR
jgi:hypothetical protein